jgi:uncharacterized membrane protein (DUF106 family)
MAVINALLGRTFDVLLSLLRPLPPVAGLSLVSLLTACAILVVIRSTSDQRALAAVKRQIHADLFEMRLFNDDLRAMLRAQGAILVHNAAYLRLSLAPTLWMAVPLILVVAQLQSYFGYSGIPIGRPVLLTAQLKSPAGAQTDSPPPPIVAEARRGVTAIDGAPGIRIDTPAIWFPSLQQVVWRVVVDAPGDYILRVRVGQESYDKTLHASNELGRRSPVRPSRGLLGQLMYPSEAPLQDSAPLTSITVSYPEGEMNLFGWRVGWMTTYLVESLAFALALKTPLRVIF